MFDEILWECDEILLICDVIFSKSDVILFEFDEILVESDVLLYTPPPIPLHQSCTIERGDERGRRSHKTGCEAFILACGQSHPLAIERFWEATPYLNFLSILGSPSYTPYPLRVPGIATIRKVRANGVSS